MNKEQRTYHCRIPTGANADSALSAYAAIYGKAERSLFARLRSGGNLTDLKREFLPKYGITARQFNSLAAEIKGKIASIKERRVGLIAEAEHRIARAEDVLRTISDPAKRHQKKRRLATLEVRLAALKADKDAGIIRLCFGSKKLFRAQFALKENGYDSRKEWRDDWRSSRNSQFFVVGSKDETAGCQSCISSVQDDGSLDLKLRLPNAMAGSGKYLDLRGLTFKHGHNAISAAIGRNLSDNKTEWQPISYRFRKDAQGWRVFVTVAVPEIPLASISHIGVIGIDINAGHLAVTETDRYGNPVKHFPVACVTYGKTKDQRSAVIGDAVKRVIAYAVSKQKPLVIEKLDFKKKKAELEKESRKHARMLSSLAYSGIQAILRARAFDAGVTVHDTNPAYTSVIGKHKFSARYGLSGHAAAALVIGRRFSGLRETLPVQLHGTLPLSARNRGRHVWSKWASVSRMAKAAHEAHGRSGTSRSSPSPVSVRAKARPVTYPFVAGGIPAGESSPALFG